MILEPSKKLEPIEGETPAVAFGKRDEKNPNSGWSMNDDDTCTYCIDGAVVPFDVFVRTMLARIAK